MRGAVMHAPGEVRVEAREAPQIVEPTDAIIRVSAACVCGSDLWPYRGIGVEDSMWPMPMGHEYAGIVEEVPARSHATVEDIRFMLRCMKTAGSSIGHLAQATVQKRPRQGGRPGMRTTVAASARTSSSSTPMISTISCSYATLAPAVASVSSVSVALRAQTVGGCVLSAHASGSAASAERRGTGARRTAEPMNSKR
jgi:threonine dehydrogenase-like Zn-dependent dehydrogenase